MPNGVHAKKQLQFKLRGTLVLCVICLIALAYFPLLRFVSNSEVATYSVVWVSCLGFAAIDRLYLLARRLFAVSGASVLRSDRRPPILYLRSYRDEEALIEERGGVLSPTPEWEVTSTLKFLGPVVAIAGPNEGLPPLGAARLYIDSDNWQEEVSGLLKSCGLVILVATHKPNDGIAWELHWCFRQIPYKPVLIVFPYKYGGIYSRRERYLMFKEACKRITGIDLPETTNESIYLFYPTPNKPRVLQANLDSHRNPLATVLSSLNPSAYRAFIFARRRSARLYSPLKILCTLVLLVWIMAVTLQGESNNSIDKAKMEAEFCDTSYIFEPRDYYKDISPTMTSMECRDLQTQKIIAAQEHIGSASRIAMYLTEAVGGCVLVVLVSFYVKEFPGFGN